MNVVQGGLPPHRLAWRTNVGFGLGVDGSVLECSRLLSPYTHRGIEDPVRCVATGSIHEKHKKPLSCKAKRTPRKRSLGTLNPGR